MAKNGHLVSLCISATLRNSLSTLLQGGGACKASSCRDLKCGALFPPQKNGTSELRPWQRPATMQTNVRLEQPESYHLGTQASQTWPIIVIPYSSRIAKPHALSALTRIHKCAVQAPSQVTPLRHPHRHPRPRPRPRLPPLLPLRLPSTRPHPAAPPPPTAPLGSAA